YFTRKTRHGDNGLANKTCSTLLKPAACPLSMDSKSLKVLTLAGIEFDYSAVCTSNWELPALTTLHLIGVTLYDDEDFDEKENYEAVRESWDEFFSKCPKLKYLTLDDCSIGGGGFHICHPQLSNLKLANGDWGSTTFSVDTPQLKNLSIINCGFVYLLSAPELTSLIYRHLNAFEFDAECLPSLEKVDLCICNPHPGNMEEIVDVLQKFQSVKFLTINVEIPQLLSSQLELVSNKPSPFANLKSLKIYPAIIDELEECDYSKDDYDDEYEFKYELQNEDEDEEEEEEGEEEEEEEEEEEDEDEEVNICAEVKNFFLNSSRSATVTKVTCQEIRAVTTPEVVINLMEELQVLLKEEKAKIIMARKKRGKTPMQSHVTELHQQGKTEVMKKMQLLTEERVLTTESRWKDPSVQNYLENGKIGHMVSKLQAIKGVLATLPTSKRGEMKACFGRLFAEANLVMKKIDDAITLERNVSRNNFHKTRMSLIRLQENGESFIKDYPNSSKWVTR
ncbi:F-box domain containing protein, partial [Tanacetum coccineum]